MNLTRSTENHTATKKEPLIYNGGTLRLCVSKRKGRTLENRFLVQSHTYVHTPQQRSTDVKGTIKPKRPTLCLFFILEAFTVVYI